MLVSRRPVEKLWVARLSGPLLAFQTHNLQLKTHRNEGGDGHFEGNLHPKTHQRVASGDGFVLLVEFSARIEAFQPNGFRQ